MANKMIQPPISAERGKRFNDCACVGELQLDPESARETLRKRYPDSALAQLLANNNGSVVHKWLNYIPIYERYFSQFRGEPIRFIEIGVYQGGSMKLWREYFGDAAEIYGIDIDPRCQRFDGEFGKVRIGSQNDPAFLRSVVAEMGGVDIILDDGSHMMQHIRASFEVLFPLLSTNGLYFIEDLHTCYWPRFGGGADHPDIFFKFVMGLNNDINRWFHHQALASPKTSPEISAIHLHESIAVFEKEQVFAPLNAKIGAVPDDWQSPARPREI